MGSGSSINSMYIFRFLMKYTIVITIWINKRPPSIDITMIAHNGVVVVVDSVVDEDELETTNTYALESTVYASPICSLS